MAASVDAIAHGVWSSGTSLTVALTTPSANDLIEIFLEVQNANVTISSVTDSAGLVTWQSAKRAEITGYFSTTFITVWYGIASGTLSSDTITINLNGTPAYNALAHVYAVKGYNTSAPFDSHAGFPASANVTSGGSVPTVSGLSTNGSTDLIIAFVVDFTNSVQTAGTINGVSATLGYSVTHSTPSDGGNMNVSSEYASQTSALASASATFGTTSSSGYVMVVDAIQAASGAQALSGAAGISASLTSFVVSQKLAGSAGLAASQSDVISQKLTGASGIMASLAIKISQLLKGSAHITETSTFGPTSLTGSAHVAVSASMKVSQKLSGSAGIRAQLAAVISQRLAGSAGIRASQSTKLTHQILKGAVSLSASLSGFVVSTGKPFKIGSLKFVNWLLNLVQKNYSMQLTEANFSMLLSNYPLNQGSELYVGDSVRLEALSVTDITGASVTNPTSITITVRKPDGSTFTISTGITNDTGGNYHYDLTDPTKTNLTGTYFVAWQFVNGSYQGTSESSFVVNST